MRLSYVFDENLPSNATDTEQVNNTVAALSRAGVDVELILPQRRGTPILTAEGLRAYYQVNGTYRIKQVPAALSFARPLEKLMHAIRGCKAVGETDLVYSRNLAIVQAALATGHRVMYEHYRPWPDQYPPLEPWLRSLFRNPKLLGVVLHSEHVRKSYSRLDIPEERLMIAHNGYDPNRMLPRLSIEEARKQLDLPLDRRLVIYTGRVKAQKGVLSILALARRLPHVGFVLVGSEGTFEVEREALKIPNVIVRPWQPFDVTIRYLYAADVLIIPPTLSPLKDHGTTVLPMKLFQYLASGRPIFAPFAPDTNELLHHDENAVLVKPDDLDSQEQELLALLGSQTRWHHVVAGALADSVDMTWDARAQKLISFIENRLTAPVGSCSDGDWTTSGWLHRSVNFLGRRLAPR